RSRPYLFSNTLAPVIAGTTLAVIDMIESSSSERDRLRANQRMFRASIREAGFRIVEGDHPIVPVLFGHLPDDAALAQEFADRLLGKGIYAIGFFYPIVPRGESRIRVQLSAAHTSGQIKRCVQAFSEVGRELGVI
ncbi:MAG: aminotransferase class I/II-fold pyridoxal phosphate-dependent enzyme, partial [Candidatus Fermentibacteraceae bacterium]|nr:aminotransferase class I/II-fold pyridoxal phosphate-dependent enzyme [Candidatus Fermentibacteraceae bacterium]